MSLALVALLLCAGDPAPIHWKGRALSLADLPADLPAAARTTLQSWHPWCSAQDYRLDLDASGKVLLVSQGTDAALARRLELVAAVRARFEAELPRPARRLEVAPPKSAAPPPAPKPPADGPAPLPEDPEDAGDHPWKLGSTPPAERSSGVTSTTHGALGLAPDSQTTVLVIVPGEEQFATLLTHLGETWPFLAEWARGARVNQGFVLGEPCVAAYLEAPAGVDEWNPENELVHRVARLLVLDRFGEQPNWFLLGYSWSQEIALLGGVYCFPWRDEFVFATEHGSWPSDVRNRYARTKLAPEAFMGLTRGAYVDEKAKASWAMCAYLAAKEREKLPALLEELRVYRLEHERVEGAPGEWRKDTSYEIPLEVQAEHFARTLGEGYLARATVFVRKEL